MFKHKQHETTLALDARETHFSTLKQDFKVFFFYDLLAYNGENGTKVVVPHQHSRAQC